MLSHLALVSESSELSSREVIIVGAALQKQLLRDFEPIWGIRGTINGFATLEDVPLGYRPILVLDDLEAPGASGLRLDEDGRPFGLVHLSDTWAFCVSQLAMTMLVDPMGTRLHAGPSIHPAQPGRVEYLVGICDPSGAWEHGYDVNGVHVSDFYTPDFFGPGSSAPVRYSFTGALARPRSIRRGGHLAWLDPSSGEWWQQIWFGAEPEIRNLGRLEPTTNHREQIDRQTRHLRPAGAGGALPPNAPQIAAQVLLRSSHSTAATARAQRLRKHVDTLSRARAKAKGASA
jgi:hypothetical protein